ncbi:MAG TPA: selenocysteine-specific translation elongation factor, partial [Candidatus Limnocylindrales bacterium]|nr:selenocysteine-specific translation elongation factor [Candidatus Limnocylindrales bacterium]
MTVVVGTAGHIDHGKTALLRALTGIDADRLPEERRRGMTIDVGYAHLDLPGGGSLDFVDVPGHDRLVGNMLVGAGEIDAALLVVAIDDGPRAQTLEHLELLDALRVTPGVVAVTKADVTAPDDPRRTEVVAAIRDLVERTSLAGAPVVVTSAETGEGLDELRAALLGIRDIVEARATEAGPDARGDGRPRLAIDRVFAVRGRGTVVTGTLRGGSLAPGRVLRVEPGGTTIRVREVQVHGGLVDQAPVGRTALNVAGTEAAALSRGQVFSDDPAVVPTDRLLVVLHRPVGWAAGAATGGAGAGGGRRQVDGRRPGHWPPIGEDLRLHLGTAQAGATIRRPGPATVDLPGGATVVEVRLDRPIAARPGDRFALRRPSPASTVGGGRVLDPRPPTGPSRRRATAARLGALGGAADDRSLALALVALHGALPAERWAALGGSADVPEPDADGGSAPRVLGSLVVDAAIADELAAAARETVVAHLRAEPDSLGVAVGALRTALALGLRRRAATAPPAASSAASALIDHLVAVGRLERDGDRIRPPGASPGVPAGLAAAMERLEALLAVAAPPSFSEAVAAAACPAEGVRALETSGRIVRLEPELAYATVTYRQLAGRALELAAAGPLAPAAFRDATGSSRKYALAILEDLDRRGVLRRTP